MKKSTYSQSDQKEKVIAFTLDAGFYYDRAVKYLNRRDYTKAQKYFRLALEKEPDNPVHYINLAGLLAELSQFEESSQLLLHVLTEIDANLGECWFYLANNATHLEEYEQSEEYLVEYLSREPDGEFAEEAEELLYMLSFELGRPTKEPVSHALPDFLQKHDEARWHLGEGRFLQATEILEKLTQEHPEFLPARNNLALSYYYLGKLELAMAKVNEVLEADPSNLHGLCNLAILTQEIGKPEQRNQILDMLKKLVPFQVEHAYKLGITMGILGQHYMAYELFTRILKVEEHPEATLYHYAATASVNIGRIELAQRFWKQAQAIDPESDIPRFYLDQLKVWKREDFQNFQPIRYRFHLPYEEEILRMNREEEEGFEEMDPTALLQESCEWALQHGNHQAKVQVLNVLGWNPSLDSEPMLRSFLQKREEEDELKQIALFLLRRKNAEPPYMLWYEDQWIRLDQPDKQPEGIPKWKQVLRLCQEQMEEYEEEVRRDAKILWEVWLKEQSTTNLDTIRKVEAWAAALEYVVIKSHGLALSQSKVAEKYKVASSTVARKAKLLQPYLTCLTIQGGTLDE